LVNREILHELASHELHHRLMIKAKAIRSCPNEMISVERCLDGFGRDCDTGVADAFFAAAQLSDAQIVVRFASPSRSKILLLPDISITAAIRATTA
jgi:hypothetical protein